MTIDMNLGLASKRSRSECLRAYTENRTLTLPLIGAKISVVSKTADMRDIQRLANLTGVWVKTL